MYAIVVLPYSNTVTSQSPVPDHPVAGIAASWSQVHHIFFFFPYHLILHLPRLFL
jgi:hypothetical protein